MTRGVWIWVTVVALLGCGNEPTRDLPLGGEADGPVIAEGFDLGLAIDQVRHAFRPEGDHFEAYVHTHRVDATPTGAFDYRPIDWPEVAEGERQVPVVGDPAGFETVEVLRERGAVSELAVLDVVVEDRGTLAIERADLVERLRNHAEGVEQTWTFDAPPAGGGDLRVEVAVHGYDYVTQTAHGHHFSDPESGLGVRYGLAYWVESDGTRHDVPVVWETGKLVLRVPASVLDNSSYPATLDPTISSEKVVNSPVNSPNAFDEDLPAVASDGTEFLIVWGDRRNLTDWDIYGARVRQNGTSPNTYGIKIHTAAGDQLAPSVAFDGTNYTVVWQDGAGPERDIRGVRVDTSGALVGSAFDVSTAAGDQVEPDATANGSTIIVGWEDRRTATPTATVARVSAGTVLDASGVAVSTVQSKAVDVACGGGTCLVSWTQGASPEDVWGAYFDPGAGTAAAAFAIDAGTGRQITPSASYDGTNFAVVYATQGAGGFDIAGVRVDTAGTVLDMTPISIAAGAGLQSSPVIETLGSTHLVAFHDNAAGDYDIRGQRLDASLAAVGGAINICTVTGNQRQPSITASSNRWFVGWHDRRVSNAEDIYAARVSSAGTVQDSQGRLFGRSGNRQTLADVASDGTNYLVVWTDNRNSGDYEVWAALMSTGGVVRNQRSIASGAGTQQAPGLTYDPVNGQFLVVWHSDQNGDQDVFASRVTTTGNTITVLDGPAGFAVSTQTNDQRRAEVAFNGTEYLVVWQDRRGSNWDIYGQRVSAAGTLVGGELAIATATGHQERPEVASDGTDWMVVWGDERGGSDADDIYSRRVGAGGALAGEVVVTSASDEQLAPSITFGSSQYLVIWMDLRKDSENADIHGNTISTAGVAGTEFSVAVTDDAEGRPSIATEGSHYIGTWTQSDPADPPSSSVIGVRLDVTGSVVDGPFTITNQPNSVKDSPAVGTRGSHVAVAYSRFVEDAPNDTERLRVRFFEYSGAPPGQPCTGPGECDSGFCVDGFCCDTACGGGLANDCQACSAALGASANGVCSPVNAGGECRAASGTCDVAETCDGVSLNCPADGVEPDTTFCRAPSGTCGMDAFCNGSDKFCPPNPVRPDTFMCRAAKPFYLCEGDSFCNGTQQHCPSNPIFDSSVECRPSTAACDPAETCNGMVRYCPTDVNMCP